MHSAQSSTIKNVSAMGFPLEEGDFLLNIAVYAGSKRFSLTMA